jgi:hypothetical protein
MKVKHQDLFGNTVPPSKNHCFYVKDDIGRVFEVLKPDDYWFANTQNAIDLDTDNRFSRFLATSAWSSDMVKDYLKNRKYIIL